MIDHILVKGAAMTTMLIVSFILLLAVVITALVSDEQVRRIL